MSTFANTLILWQIQHGRHDLPWQGTNDPYAIWVAEIMLQQTQVMTVIPYYQRFMEAFPDIEYLAKASVDDALALWSGLGYYSRGRNLHKAACLMAEHYQSRFPRHAAEIQQLPGIGRSTAAAIAAFAYGERCAILDGNVKRVFARYFGIIGYPGEKKTEALLWQKAEELLPQAGVKQQMAAYTQALMDLGATVCTRHQPKCLSCPLQPNCVAFAENRVASLPTPRPRKPLPSKETTFLIMIDQDKILLEKRPSPGIWGGLWCLPERQVDNNNQTYRTQSMEIDALPLTDLPPLDHTFTHFKLRIHTQLLQVINRSHKKTDNEIWLTIDNALQLALPAPVRKILLKTDFQQQLPAH
ncbi:A/G-specific adenine glycosylase [Nitrosomonas sp. Nm33]|uniref:A/G-specific adenine glycosylase n=1 Tax=Nitrosomonas sp. Nm33 TaxID=133724 RepID=UPI0008960320|nr:A/G-specific adenine glycosylase [Nitrosomonas sp. Nm33]SDY32526.1 A/G-specific adenine glycosylase [Nitrosomonas sp. Nm33]